MYALDFDCNWSVGVLYDPVAQVCPGDEGYVVGGGIAGSLPDIINDVQDTCLRKITSKTINNDVAGKIKDIISKLDKNVNVHIKILDAYENNNHWAGQTSETYWTKDPITNQITGFYTNITLSRYLLLESSQEHITAVLLHEVLHAYFRETTAKAEAFDGLDHQTMANDYVKPMAQFISSLYGINLTDATALAWDGIVGTKAYIDATTFAVDNGTNVITISKQDLQDINTNYVLKINGKGKGACQ